MYEPYGFKENGAYLSKKAQIENELAFNRHADSKEFTSVEYSTSLQAFLFRNIFGKVVGKMELSKVIAQELLTVESTYDKEKKAIILVFKSGQTVEISVKDLIDISEAGNGLTNDGTSFHVLIDSNSETSAVDDEPYLTVTEAGVKIKGINKIVQKERERAEQKESDLYGMILAETSRAEQSESDLNDLITLEQQRAMESEERICNIIGTGFTTTSTETVTARYHELKEYVDATFTRLQNAYDTLAATVAKNQATVAQNQATVASLQATVTSLGVDTFKAQIAALTSQVNSLNSTIASQNEKISGMESRINQLESWV